MVNLKAEQQAALERVAVAHRVRQGVRQAAEVDARRMIEQRVEAAAKLVSVAVREALDAGVPRSRVAKEGLGTSDYATVRRVLALTEATPEVTLEQEARAALHRTQVRRATEVEVNVWRHKLHASGDMLMRLDWPGYEPSVGGVLAENARADRVDLIGWAHRFYPNDDGDWEVLEGTPHLDAALRYEDAIRTEMVRAATA